MRLWLAIETSPMGRAGCPPFDLGAPMVAVASGSRRESVHPG